MAKHVEMDERVKFKDQIEEKIDGSVIVIVKLNVDPDKVEQFVKDWAIDAAIFKKQPGFISAQLNKGIGKSSVFIMYEVWESIEQYKNAVKPLIFIEIISMKPIDIKPPFDEETAKAKVKAAQDAWNTRNPELVAKAYTIDSRWRNRIEFFEGRDSIIEFLKRKWAKELDYRLMKELWCYNNNRISVRFEYEWRDADNPGQWMRTHGNEHWEFDDSGLMRIRDMSANDYPIKESERRYK